MTPEQVTPMTNEEYLYFKALADELPVLTFTHEEALVLYPELDVDDSPTVRVEVEVTERSFPTSQLVAVVVSGVFSLGVCVALWYLFLLWLAT